MTENWMWMGLGIALLVGGGAMLVHGASALARHLGVSPLVIGLTVVAFGTSAPELAVNVVAAARDSTALAFGNVVGSNLANVGLILGLSALVKPILVPDSRIMRELLWVLAVTAMAGGLAWGPGPWGGEGVLSRTDGTLLLLVFVAFMGLLARRTLRERRRSLDEGGGAEPPPSGPGVGSSAIFTLVGLGLLAWGGDVCVEAGVALASALGLPEDLIGLGLVAVGTSLPELVTSLMALRSREASLAVGNILGSNIFNLSLVMGTTATLHSVSVPPSGMLDLAVVMLLSVLLVPMCRVSTPRAISRVEGALLLLSWGAFVVWRFAGA